LSSWESAGEAAKIASAATAEAGRADVVLQDGFHRGAPIAIRLFAKKLNQLQT